MMGLTSVLAFCCCLSLAFSEECSPPVVNVFNGDDTGCCPLVSTKLDTISSQLSSIEARLSGPRFSDWEVVFRGNAGVASPNLLDLWKGATTLNADVAEAKKVDGTFSAPYKSSLVENWGALDIKKVKFAFYDDGEEVMTLIFNGVGSNKMNWFSRARLLQTPYPDMLTSSFNKFAIDPSAGTCPQCRMWYISKNHGGCPNDNGWVAVTGHQVCLWDRAQGDPAPRFLYSSTDGVINWQSEPPAKASVMAISIQTGV
ncbi:uncharacterized protein LOC117104819 [Anneissia japonica]|uniref:uncharacterized protein LOC117104819 n=1 Tax=Anneissia japonica TaxID=1529436 RepID=UPI001425A4F8|nr:uncharacterized protein LOC117104819 [Anneissia japonica]